MLLASYLQRLRSPRRWHRRKQPGVRRPWFQGLEDRTLLTVQFTPGPYLSPGSRPAVPLGTIGSNFPASPLEPILAVNSTDPGNIAVSSANGVRITTDAGAAFSRAVAFKPPSGFSSFGDTDLKFDGQGRLFWSNLGNQGRGLFVSQIDPSTGANLKSTVVSNGPEDDKPFIAIDVHPESPFFNNIYIVWTHVGGPTLNEVFFSRSTDQAATWSPPLQLSDAAVEGLVEPSDVSVGPSGDVYVAYHSQPEIRTMDLLRNPDGTTGQTFVLRSGDGGRSFPQKSVAFGPGHSDVTYNLQFAARTIPGTRFLTAGSSQPWVLADPVRPGNVYVVTADDPTDSAGAPYARVVFARSTDNGATWSFPQPGGMIAPLAGDSFQVFPTAAIDPFGDIVVAWYDNRRGQTNRNGRFLLDVFATYSSDGGLTWAMPFPVNPADQPFDPDPGVATYDPGPPLTTWIGEYFGSGLFGGTAYLAWDGNTFSAAGTPVGEQVWFSAFALSGALTITGGPGDDTITVRSMTGNRDFLEVLVNGRREYAGLWSGLTGITIAATTGNDTINIEDIPAGIPATISLGDGTDTLNLSPMAKSLSALAGTITINGGSGSDTLDLFDSETSDNGDYTFTSSTVARSGVGTVMYQGLASLVLHTGKGNNTITAPSTLPGTAVTIDGGSGSNSLIGSDGDNTWSITGHNAGTLSSAASAGGVTFSAVQNLLGGTDRNAFVFSDGAGISGSLDGGGGGALDYSAYRSSVIVDLQTGTATGVGGTVANIQNVVGGTGGGAGIYTILVGSGGDTLIGGTGRRNLLIAGSSASTLQSGDGEDILIGGTTRYDMDLTSLQAIMDYWSTTADDYATRVATLLAGNGVPLLDATTVTGNGGSNVLSGNGALGLLYTNGLDTIGGFDPNAQQIPISP